MVIAVLILVALPRLLAYGWFEAGWLRTRVLEVPVDGLPAELDGCGSRTRRRARRRAPVELDGLRIAHLSDFHLGPPSRGSVAVRKAAAWVRERRPDLVVATGDLLSHPRGRAAARRDAAGPRRLRRARKPRHRGHARPVLPPGRAGRAAGDAAPGRVADRRAARQADPDRRHGPAPGRGGAGRRMRTQCSGCSSATIRG